MTILVVRLHLIRFLEWADAPGDSKVALPGFSNFYVHNLARPDALLLSYLFRNSHNKTTPDLPHLRQGQELHTQ